MTPAPARRTAATIVASLVVGAMFATAVLQITGEEPGPKAEPRQERAAPAPTGATLDPQVAELQAQLDELDAATPTVAKPSGQLGRAGYQRFLDYLRKEVGVEVARAVVEGSQEAATTPQLLRLTASALDPAVEAYRVVSPPSHVAAEHRRMIEAQVAYQQALVRLADDPAWSSLDPTELQPRLAKLPEVTAMWEAMEAITAKGYETDPRARP